MAERIELPQTPNGTAEEQLRQMYSYLYRVAQALNHNLSEIGSMDLTDEERMVMQQITAEDSGDTAAEYDWQGKESLKSLIIKTAAFVQNALDSYRLNLLGEYVAEGKFGRYVRNTGLKVDVTPTGIQQDFTFEEVVQGLKTYTINAKNYIKTGLLRTVQSIPVYGVAIGKDVVTFAEDGTETYNDGNKVAELTADELSFYQGGDKVASYTGSKISFLMGGTEVFYIQSGKIHSNIDLELSSGKKLIINTTNFKVDSSGNVEIIGTIKAGSTFAGTMSAGCITSGTMSADRISGGTIDASQTTVKNLDASKITSGTMSANKISGGSIDASNVTITNLNASNITSGTMSANRITSGTMSADRISGGTIDASQTTVKNLDASKITTGTMSANKISGGSIDASNVTITNLNASNITSGTMSANRITSGTMSADRISGGTIDASQTTVKNLDASKITSGTMSANKISGGSIDASNVTITNLNASNVTSGTMSANKISGGTIDASNVTINNLNASKITSGTMSASKISGGELTLGGSNNANGKLIMKNASNSTIGEWNKDGFSSSGGTFDVNYTNLKINSTTGKIELYGSDSGAIFKKGTGAGQYTFGVGKASGETIGKTADIFQTSNGSLKFAFGDNSIALTSDLLLELGSVTEGGLFQGATVIRPSTTGTASLGTNSYKFSNAYINTVYYSSLVQNSSRELKNNIKPLEYDEEMIDRLQPVSFTYRNDRNKRKNFGLIFEDTVEVLPEVCMGHKYANAEEKGINYVELVPVLLKEIQKLRARVKALEER